MRAARWRARRLQPGLMPTTERPRNRNAARARRDCCSVLWFVCQPASVGHPCGNAAPRESLQIAYPWPRQTVRIVQPKGAKGRVCLLGRGLARRRLCPSRRLCPHACAGPPRGRDVPELVCRGGPSPGRRQGGGGERPRVDGAAGRVEHGKPRDCQAALPAEGAGHQGRVPGQEGGAARDHAQHGRLPVSGVRRWSGRHAHQEATFLATCVSPALCWGLW